jgi:hypothetical protein
MRRDTVVSGANALPLTNYPARGSCPFRRGRKATGGAWPSEELREEATTVTESAELETGSKDEYRSNGGRGSNEEVYPRQEGERGRGLWGGPCSSGETLKILYTNAQSILGKISELECVAAEQKPDVILICESWCNSTVNDSLLALEGYELQPDLRVDKSDTAGGIGGGLLVYVRDGLNILAVNKTNDFNQLSSLTLATKKQVYKIFLIYQPQAQNLQNRDLLLQVLDSTKKNSVFIGDFNMPGINRIEGTPTVVTTTF